MLVLYFKFFIKLFPEKGVWFYKFLGKVAVKIFLSSFDFLYMTTYPFYNTIFIWDMGCGFSRVGNQLVCENVFFFHPLQNTRNTQGLQILITEIRSVRLGKNTFPNILLNQAWNNLILVFQIKVRGYTHTGASTLEGGGGF